MLPRDARLTRTAEYREVYDHGRAERGRSVVCLTLSKPAAPTRVGIVASRRVGGAVQRNRAKRRLREAMRRLGPELPAVGHHVVLVATSRTGTVEYAELLDELRELLAASGLRIGASEGPRDCDTSAFGNDP